MDDPLLTTKISLPNLHQLLVPRRALLKKLDGGIEERRILTLVCAPAGYGKTNTTRMWVEGMRRQVAPREIAKNIKFNIP